MGIFYAFWNAIKKKYSNAWSAGIKNEGGQIFYKASMLVLQELLFDTMVREMPKRSKKAQPSPFADPQDLAETVDASLYFLPEEFFTRTWQETGLDTSERREFLRKQMDEAINKQGEKLGVLALFKAKTKGRDSGEDDE